jgi:hypothetical protein
MNITKKKILTAIEAINNMVPKRWSIDLKTEKIDFYVVRGDAILVEEEIDKEKGQVACSVYVSFEVEYYKKGEEKEDVLYISEFVLNDGALDYSIFRDNVSRLGLIDPDEVLRQIYKRIEQAKRACLEVSTLSITDESTIN